MSASVSMPRPTMTLKSSAARCTSWSLGLDLRAGGHGFSVLPAGLADPAVHGQRIRLDDARRRRPGRGCRSGRLLDHGSRADPGPGRPARGHADLPAAAGGARRLVQKHRRGTVRPCDSRPVRAGRHHLRRPARRRGRTGGRGRCGDRRGAGSGSDAGVRHLGSGRNSCGARLARGGRLPTGSSWVRRSDCDRARAATPEACAIARDAAVRRTGKERDSGYG
jgi:hypothetical protein